MITERRKKQQRKKQILFLCIVILATAAGIGGYLFHLTKEKQPSFEAAYGESSEEEGILYGGKRYVYNDHLSNYLFMGVDSRNPVDTYDSQRDAGQADAILLVSLDRAEKTLQVLSIPRDTMTMIEVFTPSGNSRGLDRNHINLQYAFGDGKRKSCELMKNAVSSLLYQLPIENYCSLNMDAIPILTRITGGVELTVPDDSLEELGPEYKEGARITLTEENTEQFVRNRDTSKSQSAIVRMNRQKVFLKAYLEKVQKLAEKDAGIVTELYEGVKAYMVTGMSTDLFAKLLEASMTKPPVLETIPGEGTEGKYFDEYLVNDDELYEQVIRMFYKEVNA